MKHIIKPVLLSMGVLLALSACREIEGVEYLNVGHPADPEAQAGKKARMSRALNPENITVRPDLEAVGSAAPASPATMDHSKMGHTTTHRGSH